MAFPIPRALPGTVKWWDAKGRIHYSDVPPPSGWTRIEVLNEYGVVVKVITPKPPKKKEVSPQEDIPLWLRSFGSEKDLVHLRDSRLKAIEKRIMAAKAIISQLEFQKKALASQGDEQAAQETQRQIEQQQAFIRRMEGERRRIIRQFKDYIACYQALKENRPEACPLRGGAGSPPPRR